MLRHSGPARVFESERDAFTAVVEGRILKGDVVVIRYEGPKGGPGMQEMVMVTAALSGLSASRALMSRPSALLTISAGRVAP